MLPIPTLSVWDKIMKLKLNLTGRQGCQVAGLNLNMSVVPRSLCAVKVTLNILISKWCMLYNKQKAELLQPLPLLDILRPSWVLIVDVMDVPTILKLPDHSSCTLSGWWSATMRFAWSLTVILSSNWITRQTCQKRATTSTSFALHPNTCIHWACLSRRLYRYHHARDQESSDTLCLLRFAGTLLKKYLQVSCCGGHRDHGTGLEE